MPKTLLRGRLSHQLRSLAVLFATSVSVLARRLVGIRLVPQWTTAFEIGTLFFRYQFKHALALPSIAQGRAYFDSLYTVVLAKPQVDVRSSQAGEPAGDWFIPHGHVSELTLLYFHGGGYAFYGAVSRHFIAMLAHMLQVPVFAPDYRLTPEHPHPAQLEDGLTAYRHLLSIGVDPRRIIVAGDSAGGHLALMMVAKLRDAGLPQPALVIGLSPWTDIGARGDSLFSNDRYDMVQGYQTLLYAKWLKGGTGCTDDQLSPMGQKFSDVAPIYLQAGGKEILVDRIRDFAEEVKKQGAQVRLDVWPHMTHEFHAYGDTLPQSRQAINSIRAAIAWATTANEGHAFPTSLQTVADSLAVDGNAADREHPLTPTLLAWLHGE